MAYSTDKTKYIVIREDDPDEEIEFYSLHKHLTLVADDYAEKYDAGEYTLLNGEELTISIYDADGKNGQKLVVSGRMEPAYYSTTLDRNLPDLEPEVINED